jgi:hypothetical protein
MFESVVRVRGQLGELVTAVDPDAVSGDTARQLWAEFDRIERLAAGAKTLLARRIAATHDRGLSASLCKCLTGSWCQASFIRSGNMRSNWLSAVFQT